MTRDGAPQSELREDQHSRILERGLALNGICVVYQDRDLNVLAIQNAPESWPDKAEISRGGDVAIFGQTAGDRAIAAKRTSVKNAERVQLELPLHFEEEILWFEMTIEPDIDRNDTVVGLFVTSVDITDLKYRERVLKTLLREVSHRSKNLLAIIQSIAMQTARFSGSLDDFLVKFRGRIQSLSQSQDLVTDSNWHGARFSDLVDTQIARYVGSNENRVSRRGQNPNLPPNAALHVGLAIHELVVNSAIFGAIAQGDGSVTIALANTSDDNGNESAVISWTEKLAGESGRSVDAARFGSTVLEKVVPAALGGSAFYDISSDAISYQLHIPRNQIDN